MRGPQASRYQQNSLAAAAASKLPPQQAIDPTESLDDADDGGEAIMKRVMGFADFKTTKNTKVPGNDRAHGLRKDKQTNYRQYMNRVGGFNRPLSPSRM